MKFVILFQFLFLFCFSETVEDMFGGNDEEDEVNNTNTIFHRLKIACTDSTIEIADKEQQRCQLGPYLDLFGPI